jgi:hypothetical protein
VIKEMLAGFVATGIETTIGGTTPSFAKATARQAEVIPPIYRTGS